MSVPPKLDRGHLVAKCTASECGTRFPIPIGHERHGTCPICDAATTDVEAYPPPHDIAAGHDAGTELIGVLDNIRSALNVGTMLRAADGARLDHMHLCGLTAGGDHPKVLKTSLGAEASTPWTHHTDATECAAALADDGWTLWAVESTPTSVALETLTEAPPRLALIVGNERAGVDPGLLRRAERHVHLPMAGAKTTLNVGVAFGIAAYGVRAMRFGASGPTAGSVS